MISFTNPSCLQDELEDLKAAIAKKDGEIADLEQKLNTKDGIIGVCSALSPSQLE